MYGRRLPTTADTLFARRFRTPNTTFRTTTATTKTPRWRQVNRQNIPPDRKCATYSPWPTNAPLSRLHVATFMHARCLHNIYPDSRGFQRRTQGINSISTDASNAATWTAATLFSTVHRTGCRVRWACYRHTTRSTNLSSTRAARRYRAFVVAGPDAARTSRAVRCTQTAVAALRIHTRRSPPSDAVRYRTACRWTRRTLPSPRHSRILSGAVGRQATRLWRYRGKVAG